MKLEQIRNLFDISQKELSMFLGISRSVLGMALINRRDLTISDNQIVDDMYDAAFNAPGKSFKQALAANQQENEDLVSATIQRQLVSLTTLMRHKEKELAIAQRHYQKLQTRFLALLSLEESYGMVYPELTDIRLKWIEKQMLQTRYKLKTEGLPRIHQIELELHQLKSKQEFLESRLSK
jgi:transcriptional regulator with XRE-family HTH domain